MSTHNSFYTYLDCGHYRIGGNTTGRIDDQNVQLTTVMGQCPNCRREDTWQMHPDYNSAATSPISTSTFLTSDTEQQVSILSLHVGGLPSSPPPLPDMHPAHLSANTSGQNASGRVLDASFSTESWVTVTTSGGSDSEASTYIDVAQNSDVEFVKVRPINRRSDRVSERRKSPSSKDPFDLSAVSTDSGREISEVRKKQQRARDRPQTQSRHHAQDRRYQNDGVSRVTKRRDEKKQRPPRSGKSPHNRVSKRHQGSSTSIAKIGPSRRGPGRSKPVSRPRVRVKMYSFESTDEEERYKLKFGRFLRDLVQEFEPNVYENCGVDPASLKDIDKDIRFHKKKLKEYASAVSERNYQSKLIKRRSRAEDASSAQSGD